MSRKALLIGINYKGTSSELNGCINDVANVKAFLETKGYSDFTILTDDTPQKPTRANILRAIMDLITSGATHLFLHYSGHGSWIRDKSGDEADSRDECLVPIDYNTAGMIVDDEFTGILRCLTRRQTLICLLDCCHSGSAMDLAYCLYSNNRGTNMAMVKDGNYPRTNGKVVMISGCKDSQTSADSYEDNLSQGAATWSFLKAIPNCTTWVALLKKIRAELRAGGYRQVPMLSSGRPLKLTSSIRL